MKKSSNIDALLPATRELASPCKSLIADLEQLHGRRLPEAQTVAQVAQRLALSGPERRWVVDTFGAARAREYTQSTVYVAADRRFSVVALTWGPGARTCIHDHAGWCAVAVYEGAEFEKSYCVCSDANGRYLRETGSKSLECGRTIGMVADGSDIHRVDNTSRDVTISLHVYGIDIERTGTSIKSRFDTLPVRP